MNQQPSATPAWELVLNKCWWLGCPKLAVARDWAGWWFCDDHKGELMDGFADETVTWASACDAIRKALEAAS